MTRITLIAAAADNGCIGGNNRMLWHLPEDFAFFKQYTLGKPVLMGRKTWASLPKKPLPGRRNIVISRQTPADAGGAEWAGSVQAALEMCRDAAEIVVIGGAQIYAQTLPLATDIRLTRVHMQVSGDAFFPDIDPQLWQENGCMRQTAADGTVLDFLHYTRRGAA